MSTQSTNHIQLGGVLYTANTPARNSLLDFAHTLQKRGWKVRGLTQASIFDDTNTKIGFDAIDIHTGEHYPLSRPTKDDRANGTCGFSLSVLADTSAVLSRAIEEQADLLVVEKFGEREQEGNGLAPEILAAALAGIPTLIAVPASALDSWNSFTGQLSTLLAHDQDILWKWWPGENLYKDLALGIEDVPVRHIEIGKKAILVEGPNGAGVCTNPSGATHVPNDIPQSLKDLAFLHHSTDDPFLRALATAAILAHYNRYDLTGPDNSGLFHFQNRGESVLVAGNFPSDKNYGGDVKHIPPEKALFHLHENAYEGVILPAQTFSSGQLPAFLYAKGQAETVLVGPETPLSERLFSYGINVLSGRIITDPHKAREIVQQGGTPKDLKAASKYITLEQKTSN